MALRVSSSSAPNGALLHAAAQLIGAMVSECAEPNALERAVRPRAAFLGRLHFFRPEPQAQLDVGARRQPRQQRGPLEHDADWALRVVTQEPSPRIDGDEPEEDAEQRGLATPAGPDEHQELAAPDLEPHVTEDVRGAEGERARVEREERARGGRSRPDRSKVGRHGGSRLERSLRARRRSGS
jgi:hypothetical protein